MNEGQQSDYDRLRELGVTWSQAMDFVVDHPLGNTNIQHLHKYVNGLNSPATQENSEVTYGELSGAIFRAYQDHGAFNGVVIAQKLLQEYKIERKS